MQCCIPTLAYPSIYMSEHFSICDCRAVRPWSVAGFLYSYCQCLLFASRYSEGRSYFQKDPPRCFAQGQRGAYLLETVAKGTRHFAAAVDGTGGTLPAPEMSRPCMSGLQESLANHDEAELLKQGIRHKIAVDRSKFLPYEAQFD